MLTTWALQQVVNFLGYTGRAANELQRPNLTHCGPLPVV
jgi:hypothetical protein